VTLVIIFGPPAVGKMTVGLALEPLTGFRLFHNHMTVDPVIRLFPFDSAPYRRLVTEFRRRIFEEYVETGSKGLIFTFVWVLDDPEDRAFIESTVELFTSRGGKVCYVELEATQAERLRRNETPLRMAEKWLQRNVNGSRAFLLNADETYQMTSREPFFFPERYLKIDNTTLEPDTVARQIAEYFSLIEE
jgi:hypothetical protein